MPKCTNCGSYTKYYGGLCPSCYNKKDNNKKVHILKKKAKNKKEIKEDKIAIPEKQIAKSKEKEKKKNGETNYNNFNYNLTKGRIAETLIERLFVDLGFQVFQYGMENTIPGIKDLLKGVNDEVAMNIRRMPDLVVFKDGQAHFIEVKFKANGCFKLKELEKKGDYPYRNALIVLVSKKHIKCISFHELADGKEITESCRNYLGNRREFETDKEKIKEYCNYAVKFFKNV